jgi:predicted nuclease of predicted toxin-antitoxin system
MKFKLDENIGKRGIDLLRAEGHDVMTIRDQGMEGAPDEAVFHTCNAEGRALITLDHDFGQTLRFPPETSHGIVILELPSRATPRALLDRLHDFMALLKQRALGNELWIVEPGRVRIHQREDKLNKSSLAP